jgi:hypothetical protein
MIRYVLISVAVLVIAVLGWLSLNLALENDGLKQIVSEHHRSTEALLSYIRVASRCDVKPEEVAKALDATIYRNQEGLATDVSRLAFKAEFKDGQVRSVQIVNVGKTSLCSRS